MGYTWKQSKHEGVRYREHPTRKHAPKNSDIPGKQRQTPGNEPLNSKFTSQIEKLEIFRPKYPT